MQQLTEHFKFSFWHADARPAFSLRRMGADDENIVLIRFYRKKFTLAKKVVIPSVCKWSLKTEKSSSAAPKFLSVSRKSQMVFASGTLSDTPKPRKRIKLNLSFIWYSVWSSDKLYNLCKMRILNIKIALYTGRPPAPLRSLDCMALSRISEKISQFTTWLRRSKGSPKVLILSNLNSSSKNPGNA